MCLYQGALGRAGGVRQNPGGLGGGGDSSPKSPPTTPSSSSRTRWASKMDLLDLRALGLPRRASGSQRRWESTPS